MIPLVLVGGVIAYNMYLYIICIENVLHVSGVWNLFEYPQRANVVPYLCLCVRIKSIRVFVLPPSMQCMRSRYLLTSPSFPTASTSLLRLMSLLLLLHFFHQSIVAFEDKIMSYKHYPQPFWNHQVAKPKTG